MVASRSPTIGVALSGSRSIGGDVGVVGGGASTPRYRYEIDLGGATPDRYDRVEIDHEHPIADVGQAGGEIDGGGRLAHPALLIRNRDDLAHSCALAREPDLNLNTIQSLCQFKLPIVPNPNQNTSWN